MSNHTVSITIPENIYKDFLDMLDAVQCKFTEEEIAEMAPRQVKLIKYVSKLVGKKATPRFKTIRAQEKALLLPRGIKYLRQ